MGGGLYNFNKHASYGVVGKFDRKSFPGQASGFLGEKIDSHQVYFFGLNSNEQWMFDINTYLWKIISLESVNTTYYYSAFQEFYPPNIPPGRSNAGSYISLDKTTITMFGGFGYCPGISDYGYCNDVWEYDVRSNMWRIFNEPNTIDAFTGYPRGRNVPIFRGINDNSFFTLGSTYSQKNGKHYSTYYTNDLWKFDKSASWTLQIGEESNPSGDYYDQGEVIIEMGTYNESNRIAARIGHSGWKSSPEALWIYGGGYYHTNDIWTYNITMNMWRCVKANKYIGGELTFPITYNDDTMTGGSQNGKALLINEDEVFLMMGIGYYGYDNPYANSLIWSYSMSKNQIKFVSGYIGNFAPLYGLWNVYSEVSFPSGRSNFGVYKFGNEILLYGGNGYVGGQTRDAEVIGESWMYMIDFSSVRFGVILGIVLPIVIIAPFVCFIILIILGIIIFLVYKSEFKAVIEKKEISKLENVNIDMDHVDTNNENNEKIWTPPIPKQKIQKNYDMNKMNNKYRNDFSIKKTDTDSGNNGNDVISEQQRIIEEQRKKIKQLEQQRLIEEQRRKIELLERGMAPNY